MKRPLSSSSNFSRRAFTLTDLLVLLAAAALVGSIVGTVMTRSRQAGRLARCTDNLQKVGQAVLRFAQEHNQTLPGPAADQPGELQWWYKEQVKAYAGLTGASSAQDHVFACPDDRGYTDSRPFSQSARFDFGSYVFNGVPLPGAPNIAGWQLSAVTTPKRTLLVMEWTAHAPLSWHRSRTGKENAPFYNDAESVVAFVDGHVNIIKIYHDGHTPAYLRDPIPGYDYRYHGN
jgi:type II secretory pathway pseudopilin PulG